MNRPVKPNPKDLTFEEYLTASAIYAKRFEMYCDELEKAVSYLAYKLDSLGACNNSGMCDTEEKSCFECWKELAIRVVDY